MSTTSQPFLCGAEGNLLWVDARNIHPSSPFNDNVLSLLSGPTLPLLLLGAARYARAGTTASSEFIPTKLAFTSGRL